MSICKVTGMACDCQPEDGVPCTGEQTLKEGFHGWRNAALKAEAQVRELKKDAQRYRWLRQQNWYEAELCVVMDPKRAVTLGHDCLSVGRLDEAIDAAMAPTQPGSKEPRAIQAEARPDGQDKYLPGSQASSQMLQPDEPKPGLYDLSSDGLRASIDRAKGDKK